MFGGAFLAGGFVSGLAGFGTGLLLVAFSGFLLLHRGPVRLRLGGVLGGLAGLSGALPTVRASPRGWGKDEKRAAFRSFNLAVLAAALLVHAAAGLVTAEVCWLVLLALPGTATGAWLGARAYRRLSGRRFHEAVLALLLASGAVLVWNALEA